VFAIAGGTSTRLSAFDQAGSRISVKDGTTLGYLVPDLLGSVVATETSSSTAVASALRYDGYGRTAAQTTPAGTVALDHRFTGALDVSPDAAAALYDIGARDYSPTSGAWTALDTYGGSAQDPASMNRFLYAHANPTTLIDPTGHFIYKGDKDEYPTPEAKQRIQDNIRQHGNASGSAGGGASSGDAWTYHPGKDIATPDERMTYIGDIKIGSWGGPTTMADLERLGQQCMTFTDQAACEAYRIGLESVPEDPEAIHSLLDATGVFDPTPISDWANAGRYASEGDLVNAGVSGVSGAGWFVTDLVKLPRLGGKILDALLGAGKRVDNLPLGPALPKELTLGRNADVGVDVYVGTKNGKEVYVGITNNIARRQSEHGTRFDIRALSDGQLTRGQARAVEQAMIVRARESGLGYVNELNSISPSHGYYDQAVQWGETWLRANGY
jgi:RHS repeat-associated protein